MPRRRHPRRVVALAVVLATVLVASSTTCSGAREPMPRLDSDPRPSRAASGRGSELVPDHDADLHPADPSTAGLPARWRPAPLRWASCEDDPNDPDLSCATLVVPLDWSRPDGATIELAVARRTAAGPADERIGTIVANPGGPGGSGVELVEDDPFSPGIARRFDRVGWDPRGVGDSTPVTCGTDTVTRFVAADPDPDSPAEQAELERLARAVSDDCATHDAELLAHIGTRDVVRDLEALRLALDDGPIDYVGFSYGTQIGQMYADAFPAGIRTMVLDGVVDPSKGFTEFLMGQIDGFDAAFDAAAARCSARSRACGVEDLTAAYDRVRDRVERAPLRTDAHTPIGPAELATAAIYTGYLTDGWRQLGPALASALDDAAAPLSSRCPTPTTTSAATAPTPASSAPTRHRRRTPRRGRRSRTRPGPAPPGSAARSPTSCCRARPGRSAPTSSPPRSPLPTPHRSSSSATPGIPRPRCRGPAPSPRRCARPCSSPSTSRGTPPTAATAAPPTWSTST